VLHQLSRGTAGGTDRHDLVVVAVHDQGRDVESLQVEGKSVSEMAAMQS
jgi:hypothetical protein